MAVQQVSLFGPTALFPGVFDSSKATERDSGFAVSWSFHKEKIAVLRVKYLGYTPENLAQFIRDYAAGSNMPEAIFKVKSQYKAEAKCDGFSVYLTTAFKIDERTRQLAEVQLVDRKVGESSDRSDFESKLRNSRRQQEELRRNPKKIIYPGGPIVGPGR